VEPVADLRKTIVLAVLIALLVVVVLQVVLALLSAFAKTCNPANNTCLKILSIVLAILTGACVY
jgi:hypothetical protein